MKANYLKTCFILEPIYPGFHEYFFAYKVFTRLGILNCQISGCESERLKEQDLVCVNLSKIYSDNHSSISCSILPCKILIKDHKNKDELGIIIGFEEKLSGSGIVPSVTLLSLNEVESNKYFYESFLLIKFQKKFFDMYIGNKISEIVSLVDIQLDKSDRKVLVYYTSKFNFYWDFRNYVAECYRESKCRIEMVKMNKTIYKSESKKKFNTKTETD
tara:strand:+ start:3116 stop:3763 length:648 start_codon:yes stop_codon:yes gene_type:complete